MAAGGLYTSSSVRVFKTPPRWRALEQARYYARRTHGEKGRPSVIQEARPGEFWVTTLDQARRYGWVNPRQRKHVTRAPVSRGGLPMVTLLAGGLVLLYLAKQSTRELADDPVGMLQAQSAALAAAQAPGAALDSLSDWLRGGLIGSVVPF